MGIDQAKMPKHIAIIMDGNGRWAERHHLPKMAGHREGVKRVEEAIRSARDIGLKILTLYTFSTENWKRPKKEVDILMNLISEYIDRKGDELAAGDIRARPIGRIAQLPAKVQLKMRQLEEKTIKNKSLLVNFAVNYGGRAEIVDACKKICEEVKRNERKPNELTEGDFSDYLYTVGLPDPDILIRTSGEFRISNFLLWQISYAEIYVTKKLWPDFRRRDLEKAILDYQKRERRYGS